MTVQHITYGEALRQAYCEELERDPKRLPDGRRCGALGQPLPLFPRTAGTIWTAAGPRRADFRGRHRRMRRGGALLGMRPIVEIMYIDFITLAMDQIVNHAAKWPQLSRGKVKMPIVFRTQGGAGRRNSSQHSQSLENWFVGIPGLIVVMPATPRDLKGLLKSAVRNDNPVVFIEHKALYFVKGDVPSEEYLIPLGVADVKRSGSDVTIVATSWMVSHALAAAEKLAAEGISCEVVDPRTLWPLDKQTICDSVRKTRRCIVVVEAPVEGGWSGRSRGRGPRGVLHGFGPTRSPRRRNAKRDSIRSGPRKARRSWRRYHYGSGARVDGFPSLVASERISNHTLIRQTAND